MNSSKTNEILKDIKTNTSNINDINTNLTDIETDLENIYNTQSTLAQQTSILSKLNDIDSNTSNINTNTTSANSIAVNNGTTLTDIETEINTLNDKMVDIGVTLDSTSKDNRIWFHNRLDYNGNNTLTFGDYSSSNVTAYYSNDSSKTQYITKFFFCYEESTAPDSGSDTYHSPSFTTYIGKMNSSNVFEAPYMTIENNRDQIDNVRYETFWSPDMWVWEYDFSDAPIKLDASDRFGQLIAGNFESAHYDSWPVGYVRGYYYN